MQSGEKQRLKLRFRGIPLPPLSFLKHDLVEFLHSAAAIDSSVGSGER